MFRVITVNLKISCLTVVLIQVYVTFSRKFLKSGFVASKLMQKISFWQICPSKYKLSQNTFDHKSGFAHLLYFANIKNFFSYLTKFHTVISKANLF